MRKKRRTGTPDDEGERAGSDGTAKTAKERSERGEGNDRWEKISGPTADLRFSRLVQLLPQVGHCQRGAARDIYI